jgi:hypothetical protein
MTQRDGFHVTWENCPQQRMKIVGLDPAYFWRDKGSDKEPCEVKYETEYVPAVRKREFITWDMFWLLIGETAGHDFADCTCGFYAYLNGVNDYIGTGRVIGVVEGYGETLIGRRGFRSKKGKILALAPSPEKPVNDGAAGGGSGTTVINGRIVNVTFTAATGSVGQAFTSMGKATNQVHSGFSGIGAAGGNGSVGGSTYAVETPEPDWNLIMDRYPGVAIFDSPEAMRLEYPATDLKEVLGDEGDLPSGEAG